MIRKLSWQTDVQAVELAWRCRIEVGYSSLIPIGGWTADGCQILINTTHQIGAGLNSVCPSCHHGIIDQIHLVGLTVCPGNPKEKHRGRIGRIQPRDVLEKIMLAGAIPIASCAGSRIRR